MPWDSDQLVSMLDLIGYAHIPPHTTPPSPPAPPLPPTETASDCCCSVSAPASENPPEPPLPPTLWARIPVELLPEVVMAPLCKTVTSLPNVPSAALPPKDAAIPAPSRLRAKAPEKPPLPPPPPMDWAKMP